MEYFYIFVIGVSCGGIAVGVLVGLTIVFFSKKSFKMRNSTIRYNYAICDSVDNRNSPYWRNLIGTKTQVITTYPDGTADIWMEGHPTPNPGVNISRIIKINDITR